MRNKLPYLLLLWLCVGWASAQYPVTYAFPGTSAPAGFTTPLSGATTGTVVNASGNANLVSVGGSGFASYTGISFTSFGVHDQYSQVAYTSSGGFETQGGTSACVNMTTGGNAVCYSGAAKQFVTYTAGSGSAVGGFCFFPNSNGTLRVTQIGNSYTVDDQGGGNSCTATITGFSGTGQPGFILDQTTDSTTRVQAFQADCAPSSCGVAAIPSITPVTGTYIVNQTVTIATTTPGATICYTIDGSTPLAATPGTCSHGTTYSGTFSTSGSTPYTEVVKAIATIAAGTNSTVQTSSITVTGTVITIVEQGCTPNSSPCNIVFPGSSRQIIVHDNDPTDTITWTSSAGATVTSTNLPTAEVTFGATTGTCTTLPAPHNPGPYTSTCTTQPTVTATSVNDPTKSATFTFSIVQTTDEVGILPYYVQIFEGEKIELWQQIFGVSLANENVTWSITTQPGGGNGVLTDTTFRSTEFTATVPGAYIITATEVPVPHNTATARVWVTASTYPYPNPSSPQGTRIFPADCSDPIFTTVKEVGPTQTNTSLSQVVTSTTAAGTCIRLHNEDVTGLSPTQYHQYVQWLTKATAAHPVYLVGVPDSLGNLPIQDCQNATGNASIVGAFAVTSSGCNLYYSHDTTAGSCFGQYPQQCGPSYITTANIHERNVLPSINYYAPGSPTLSSISRSSNVVTAVVSAASDYPQRVGEPLNPINITGGATSFNGLNTNFTLTSASSVTSGSQVLTGTITGGASNAFVGQQVLVQGFLTTANTGSFAITASTSGTLTVTNPQGGAGAETHAATGLVSFTLGSVTGTTLTWAQNGPNESGTVSGTSAVQEYWSGEQAANDHHTGDHNQWLGVQFDNVGQCIFTDDNAQSYEWPGLSGWIAIGYSDCRNFGFNGNFLYHGMYLEGHNFLVTANRFHDPLPGMQGGELKIRWTNGITAYNVMQGAGLRCIDRVEVQSGSTSIAVDQYFADPDAWANGDPFGLPGLAAQQEGLLQDFFIGNVCDTTAGQVLHYAEDINSGITTANGQAFVGFNTFNMTSQVYIFGNASNNGLNQFDIFNARFYAYNNSFWGNPGGNPVVNVAANFIAHFQTNLFETPGPDLTTPINGGGSTWWGNTCDGPCPWNYTIPLNTHMYGVTSPNFLTTGTNPINNTTYIPVGGSALNGAATTPTGIAATVKVRYYYDVTTNSLKPRTDIVSGWPTTGGAVPGGAAPTLVSIAITPNPATTIPFGATQLTATGTYSDSSTANLTSSSTWSNGGSSYFDVSQQVYGAIQNYGSGGLTVQSGTACCGGLNVGNTTGTALTQSAISLSGNAIKAVTTGDSYNMQVFTNGLDCSVLPGGTCAGVTDIWAEVHVYIPSGNTVPDALEGPNVTNYTGSTQQYPSVQCNGTTWDLWNGAAGSWVSSGHACTNFLTATNVWHDVKAHYVINQGTNTMTYVDLTFDGTPVFAGGTTTFSGISFVSAAAMKAQFQIDGANGSSLFSTTAYYDNWTVTVAPGTPGLVTGISVGSGTVSATNSSITGTATVNVVAPPPSALVGGRAKVGGSSRIR